MPQLRLTAKAAKLLKASELGEPKEIREPLDDWCIDLFKIGRKSYFVIMHMKSRVAFCVPCSKLNSSPAFLGALPALFQSYFDVIGCPDIGYECYEYFFNANVMAVYTKTASASITAHMTQFKRWLQYTPHTSAGFFPAALDDCHRNWADGLVKIPGSNNKYDRPIRALECLLGIEPTHHEDNVIPVDFRG